MNIPSIGWREWLCLPDLGISHIKAKVDTGARTSALHAFKVEPFDRDGRQFVRFSIHPFQKDSEYVVTSEAPVVDYRQVTDSGGHREMRYVIETAIRAGDHQWVAEFTLTNRENMKFRMLLGRTALRGRFLVNAQKSYLVGKIPESQN
ncbi:ATP-dependent zinc protease family protein [Hahella ganghwensis]|uniref:ATP-dependent zinc protease family protein n=1 Tax=Hahella ganghwensis TaxID=286420 RepID=UPI00037FD060|nr:ATP-dependent zinc protease [Hahella ganghwensis]